MPMAKTHKTTCALVGFMAAFSHPAGHRRRSNGISLAADTSASPNLVRITASPHQRQACLYYHNFQFALHILRTARFSFYVMSLLLLAQARPADLYIHSLMLYDIHATTSSAYK